MTTLHKISLCLLLLIVSLNILLYSWFSSRVKEASAEIVVQKAYIVSRMISEAGGRSLTARQPDLLRSAVEEALKDRHLVGVLVKKNSGETVLETSAENYAEKLSRFETPIVVNGKKLGTVITRFRNDGEGFQLATSISRAAAVQSGLFTVIAALLVGTIRWKRRGKAAEAAPADDKEIPFIQEKPAIHAQQLASSKAVLSITPLQLDWHPDGKPVVEAVQTLPPLHICKLYNNTSASLHPFLQLSQVASPELSEPAESFREAVPAESAETGEPILSHPHFFQAMHEAGDALREALEILTAQARQRREYALLNPSAGEASRWQNACAVATGHAGILISTGMNIIDTIRQECRQAAHPDSTTGFDLPARLRQGAAKLLAADSHLGSSSALPDLPSEMDAAGEAELFREIDQSLRQEALPDLIAVRSASEASAAVSDSLGKLLSWLATGVDVLLAGSEELYESAALLDEGEAEQAAAVNSGMAAPLLALAESHGDRIMTFKEQVRMASALQGSLDTELQRMAQLYSRAGSAVENAATAALQGSAIIARLQATAARQPHLTAGAAELMNGLADELSLLPDLLRRPEQASGALTIAAETLQMATTILNEVVQTNPWQALSGKSIDNTEAASEAEAEQLIRQAQISIGHLQLYLSERSGKA